MIFPVKLPLSNPSMSFKIYDKDYFSSDEYLASGTIILQEQLNNAYQNETSIKLFYGEEDYGLGTNLPCKSRRI